MSVPPIVVDEKTITNQYDVANIFNNCFKSVADSVNADNKK
jgi:hypothetical protein